MIIIRNNPELAHFMGKEEVLEYIKDILKDIEEDSLRKFVKDGYKTYFKDMKYQLKNSFRIIRSTIEDHNHVSVQEVERSFDGKIFKLNDVVDANGLVLPITRMYLDSPHANKLNIKLSYPDGETFTWRCLADLK